MRSESFAYDSLGNMVSMTDPLGNMTRYSYDEIGGQSLLASDTDPLGRLTTYTYDAAGDPTSATDPLGNVTSYTYDAAGALASGTDPLGKTTSFLTAADRRLRCFPRRRSPSCSRFFALRSWARPSSRLDCGAARGWLRGSRSPAEPLTPLAADANSGEPRLRGAGADLNLTGGPG